MAILTISEERVYPKEKIRMAMQNRMDEFKEKVKGVISIIN